MTLQGLLQLTAVNVRWRMENRRKMKEKESKHVLWLEMGWRVMRRQDKELSVKMWEETVDHKVWNVVTDNNSGPFYCITADVIECIQKLIRFAWCLCDASVGPSREQICQLRLHFTKAANGAKLNIFQIVVATTEWMVLYYFIMAVLITHSYKRVKIW